MKEWLINGSSLLNLFMIIVWGTKDGIVILEDILSMAGMWKMLEKSGIKGWWALIPAAREYQLSRCADRESEGRVLFGAVLGVRVLNILHWIMAGGRDEGVVAGVDIMTMALLMVELVYWIRVLLGLVKLYGVKRRWIWLWLFPHLEWLPPILWGFDKRYEPAWKVEDFREKLKELAFYGSAATLEEGLTVNLTERAVRDFFQKKVLLRDIHMSIPLGHMVLLLGGSGAGKTTYLNAINGYEKAKAEVLLNGKNLYTQYKQMQYEVGFVPQQEMMRGKDTVLNTLLDAATLRLPQGVPAALRRKRVEEVMEIFGLTSLSHSLVEKLSGGQKKRLSISMEFISNPSLFILDEPDSGLDGVMARELFTQLRKIADSGKIVIVITHTPDRVIDLFDDVIVLAKDSAHTGRLAWYGSVEGARKFFGQEQMEQIVKCVSGEALADAYIRRFGEVQHA